MISGQKNVRLYRQEEKVAKQFSIINKKHAQSSGKATIISNILGPTLVFCGNIMLLTVIIVAIALGINEVGYAGVVVGADVGVVVGIVTVITSFILFVRQYNQP